MKTYAFVELSSTSLDLGTSKRWLMRKTPLPHFPPGTESSVDLRYEAAHAPELVCKQWKTKIL
jgi:hypothetical protein